MRIDESSTPYKEILLVSSGLALTAAAVAIVVIFSQASSLSGAWAYITHEGLPLYGSLGVLEAVSLGTLLVTGTVYLVARRQKAQDEGKTEEIPPETDEEEISLEEEESEVEEEVKDPGLISKVEPLTPLEENGQVTLVEAVSRLGETLSKKLSSLERTDATKADQCLKSALQKAKKIPQIIRDEQQSPFKEPKGVHRIVSWVLWFASSQDLTDAIEGVQRAFYVALCSLKEGREETGAKYIFALVNLIKATVGKGDTTLNLVGRKLSAKKLQEMQKDSLPAYGIDKAVAKKLTPIFDGGYEYLYFIVAAMTNSNNYRPRNAVRKLFEPGQGGDVFLNAVKEHPDQIPQAINTLCQAIEELQIDD